MFKDFEDREMTDDEITVLVAIKDATPRDTDGEGIDWAGDVGGIPCRGYIGPDGKLMSFMYGKAGPHRVTISGGAALGFFEGDAVPEWADLPQC